MEVVTLPTYVDIELAQKSLLNEEYEQVIHGIRTWKLADDLSRYQRIIKQTQPEVVIECGTAWGGSALWFAAQGLKVITIDTNMRRSRPARWKPGAEQVTWITARSVSQTARDRAHKLTAGKRTMVCLDSDHRYKNVVQEIKLYGKLVTPGCHLVVEDGIYELTGPGFERWGGNLYHVGGPLRAIRDTLADDPTWCRDVDIEQLTPLTHHPAGWWVRQ